MLGIVRPGNGAEVDDNNNSSSGGCRAATNTTRAPICLSSNSLSPYLRLGVSPADRCHRCPKPKGMREARGEGVGVLPGTLSALWPRSELILWKRAAGVLLLPPQTTPSAARASGDERWVDPA
ncbi:unnamed protein product [Gadus morhua 'NCC']